MRILLVFFLLLLPIIANAGTAPLDISKISSFKFREVRFGQSPLYDMTCVHGYCKSQAPDGDGRVNLPFEVYSRSSDTQDVAGVEISKPKYSYWKGQLFRINFSIEGIWDIENEGIDIVLNDLARQDPLTLLAAESADLVAIGIKTWSEMYVTDSGALLSVWLTEEKGMKKLLIEVWDKKLMDEAASAANPEYKAKKIMVPEK